MLSSTGASDSPPAGEFPAGTAAGAGVPAPADAATTLSIYAFSRFRSVSFCCAISSSSRCTPSAARSFGMLVSREMLRSCSNECCVYSSALLPQTMVSRMFVFVCRTSMMRIRPISPVRRTCGAQQAQTSTPSIVTMRTGPESSFLLRYASFCSTSSGGYSQVTFTLR